MLRKLTLLFIPLLIAGTISISSAEMASPEMLTNTCVACHGADGVSQGPAIPSLAGLTRNYFVGAMLAYKYANDEAGLEKALEALYKNKEFEDAEALPRYSTIMTRIAAGYSLEEIIAMSAVFSDSKIETPKQQYDRSKVSSGEELHEEYCGNCHEDGGLSTEDDVGLLAGQWTPYLRYTLEDYLAGRRDMPKKMKTKLNKVHKEHGESGINDLLQYYASVRN